MSNDELRGKVAELIGWRFNVRVEDTWWTYRPEGGGAGMSRKLGYEECFSIFSIPDYPTSLDAAAQLRASLTEEERKIYVCELALLSADNIGGDFRDWFWTIANATAADHCRAFLAAKQAL